MFFFIAHTSTGIGNNKDKKNQKEKENIELLKSHKFRFNANSAHSGYFTNTNLSYGYYFQFDSLKVKAYLPFYGRSYSSAVYGGSGAIEFETTCESIYYTWNDRKKTLEVILKINEKTEVYNIRFSAGSSGYGDLIVNCQNRSQISFYGFIEKLESPQK